MLLGLLTPSYAAGPCAIAVTKEGRTAFIAAGRSRELLTVDLLAGKVERRVELPAVPTGIALDEAGGVLVVTCGGNEDRIITVDCASGRVLANRPGGRGVCGPLAGIPGGLVLVCNRFEQTVSKLHPMKDKAAAATGPLREPVHASLSADARTVAIANLLPVGAATGAVVRAAVTFMDVATLEVRRHVPLLNGGTSVRGIAFHPASNVCAVVHTVGRFQVPTTQVEHGWMNVSALTLVAPDRSEPLATFILDEPRRGAANPWAVGWTEDGEILCVTHAGTHELSVMRCADLWAAVNGADGEAQEIDETPGAEGPQRRLNRLSGSNEESHHSYSSLRQIGGKRRVRLPGIGPRALAIRGHMAFVTEYFSDSLAIVDLDDCEVVRSIRLSAGWEETAEERGDRLFHDATIAHQGWQSCASCHPDGRVDGLNWDLLNDGIGNPKNTKSLLYAHRTPPAMSLGARESAEQAVRSGLRHILFALRPEEDAQAIDAYLKSLRPAPSPYLTKGKLSRAAKRGERVFRNTDCASCHAGPLFTDGKAYDVGTRARTDKTGDRFDTPTLVELWRTAPYLHDGSAATVKDVILRNTKDEHGVTSKLSAREVEDLCAYLLSL